jgi:hypothetical protein
MSVVSIATEVVAPWARLYGDSKLLSTLVTFVHLGGLLAAGGFAIAADRATLRLRRNDVTAVVRHLGELQAVHRPVIIGLLLTLGSGLLMLAADLESLLPSVLFWIKMGTVTVLLANGAALQRAERDLRTGRGSPERAWRRLRLSAGASLGLWFGSVLLGTALLSV